MFIKKNVKALNEGTQSNTYNSKKIKSEQRTKTTGANKGKLFPNDVAMIVNDFLLNTSRR